MGRNPSWQKRKEKEKFFWLKNQLQFEGNCLRAQRKMPWPTIECCEQAKWYIDVGWLGDWLLWKDWILQNCYHCLLALRIGFNRRKVKTIIQCKCSFFPEITLIRELIIHGQQRKRSFLVIESKSSNWLRSIIRIYQLFYQPSKAPGRVSSNKIQNVRFQGFQELSYSRNLLCVLHALPINTSFPTNLQLKASQILVIP